ncbi:MAG TPA: hypothetical protein VES21_01270 [Nocardioidaceae bacterium]|nr:hypothetical protein [Nocardioidaceae bacterium]
MTGSAVRYAVSGLTALVTLMMPLTMTAVAQSPTPAAARLGPVVETVVRGDCQGGGGMVLRVEKQPGVYAMTMTAHGLPEGSRWRLVLSENSGVDDNATEGTNATAVVSDGGWSLSYTVPALQDPYFVGIALGPGRVDLDKGRMCVILARPAPLTGVAECRKSVSVAMVASYRDGVGFIVRWGFFGARPGSVWKVAVLAASGPVAGDRVVTRKTANARGFALGKSVFADQVNPRARMTVASAGGQRCELRMHRVLANPVAASIQSLTAQETSAGNRSSSTLPSWLIRQALTTQHGGGIPLAGQ